MKKLILSKKKMGTQRFVDITTSLKVEKNKGLNRREFIRTAALTGAGAAYLLAGLSSKIGGSSLFAQENPGKENDKSVSKPKVKVAIVTSDKPDKAVVAALALLGGMEKFVRKGQTIVVKPNIAWEKPPELAATTNPDVVTAIIKECYKAGAKTVKVVERSCQNGKRCFDICGFDKVIRETGAERVILSEPEDYKEIEFPEGREIKSWPIAKEILKCDVFINVPIVKTHGLSDLTLGIKNLMGIMGARRSELHHKIGQKMADVLSAVRPHLTIIDAYRVLTDNGPTGGNTGDVVLVKKIIASIDPVAADSCAATITTFKKRERGSKNSRSVKYTGRDISYIQAAYDMGLGESELKNMEILEKEI